MIGYIYLTHDILKNKVYIGQHKSEIYDDKYFGSGKIISRIIKKRKDTLRNYVLEWCETSDTLDESEIRWIAYFREEFGEENCYNIKPGGCTYERTEAFREKLSNSRKNKYIGRKWYNNGIEEVFLSPENIQEYLNKGYVEGRLQSVMRNVADKHIGNTALNKGKKGLYKTSKETKVKLSKAGKGKTKKKYYWQTPEGEIKIMAKCIVVRFHPDWDLIGLVE